MSKPRKTAHKPKHKSQVRKGAFRPLVPEAPLPLAASPSVGLRLVRPDGAEIRLGSLLDQVYSMEDTDGTQYHWSVSEATRRALVRPHPMTLCLRQAGLTVAVVRQLYHGMDEQVALTRDLSIPLLFVPFNGSHQLIDGWHRLFKAASTGVDELPALLLSQEDADASLVIKLPPGQGLDWGQHEEAAMIP